MNRRTLLTAVGPALAGALAGCTGSGDDGTGSGSSGDGSSTTVDTTQNADDGTSTTTSDGSTTTSETQDTGEETETDTTGGELTDSTITVTRNECGSQGYAASVGFDGDAGTVTVTGTIDGADTCATAVLADASVDDSTGELSVVVGTADDCAESEMGGQCIVEIDYEATFSFADGLPARVVVVHDGASGRQQVASARP